jgi:hypothetical protein
MQPGVLVKVAATDSHRLDSEENIVFADVGFRNIAEFDAVRFGGIVNEADHGVVGEKEVEVGNQKRSS